MSDPLEIENLVNDPSYRQVLTRLRDEMAKLQSEYDDPSIDTFIA